MSFATRYRLDRLNSSGYDAIIIGSGMGALSLGAILAKKGKKVCLLERHYTAGGFTHVFRRKQFEWDVGVHYIGEVHRKNSALKKAFDYFSNGQMKWQKMPDVYDRAIFPDKSYDFLSGKDRWLSYLEEAFPREKKALHQYLSLVYEVQKASQPYFAAKALPPIVSKLGSPFLRRSFLKLSDKTVLQVCQELGLSKELTGVLCTQWGDYGLPPGQASFVIHAMIVKHYLAGANYPVGGSASIFESIAPTIKNAGGDIFVRADVDKVMVHKGKAVGVRMANGDEIKAPIVVSSAGVVNTFHKLLETEEFQNSPYQNKMSKIKSSAGHICLYLGFEKSDADLKIEPTNQWIFPSYDHDANVADFVERRSEKFPVVYVSFPSAKDPTWVERYPDRSTAEIVSFCPFDWFKKWDGTKSFGRGEGYAEFKKDLENRLLDVFNENNPHLKDSISYTELSTPLSTKHYCNYQSGEIYGLDHTPARFRQDWLQPRTSFKNLFLTGQDVCTDGVGGALFSGILTASAILNKNVMSDVLKG